MTRRPPRPFHDAHRRTCRALGCVVLFGLVAGSAGCGNAEPTGASSEHSAGGNSTVSSLRCDGDIGEVNFAYDGEAGEDTKEAAAAIAIADGAVPDGTLKLEEPNQGEILRDQRAIAVLHFEEVARGWVVGRAEVCQ